ncbi:hypothetical protein AX15_000873 [Amanita polypyramis BW_CC]|nr:hypothetical protein AX15_000873 [Amanita polypyramis BW_CC]
MRLPRRVPWASLAELEQLCSWIYAEDADHDSRQRAIHRLSAWRAITFLPHALDSTLSLLVLLVQDNAQQQSLYLRQAYAAAIIRLVNGFVDPLQSGAFARPITSIAHQLGLPQWLVELRHASTHEELPSLELLRGAANESMTWLLHNYFLPTLNPSSTVPSQQNSLHPLAPLLKQYKQLIKLTTRDASLATKYNPAIATVLRDIEGWISEAKLIADLATGDLGWKAGKSHDDVDTNDQEREFWALGRLCSGLLEKGGLVPLSKRKRTYPANKYSPSELSVQIWSPLLHHLCRFHSDLPAVLCGRIVSRLTSEEKGDPIFAACLARWAMWSIETWNTDGRKDGYDLRKGVVVSLMQAIGHVLSEANSPVNEARELLLKLCEGRPEWQGPLTLILHPFQQISDTEWNVQDIDLMDQRLNTLQSLSPTEKQQVCDTEKPTDSVPSVIPGWGQLNEVVWRPCPIGMHCAAVSLIIPYLSLFQKNAKRLLEFVVKSFVDGANNGLDGVIPQHVLEHAKGFAIFTVFKAGFVVTARAGSGIVIAKLDDGSWSAPSAIGLAGLGVGGQAGAEMTDFLVVLNSRSAIRSFMAAGSLSLGGNLSIALGPLGRNGEASGTVNTSGKVTAMYSYSKTRGLFGGVSLEGSVIVARQDANHNAYRSPVTVKLLLGGMVEPPPWAATLIRTLDSCTGIPRYKKWVDDSPNKLVEEDYAFGSLESPETAASSSKNRSYLKKKKLEQEAFPPSSWGRRTDNGAYFYDDTNDQNPDFASSPFSETTVGSDYGPDHGFSPSHGSGSYHNRSPSATSLFVAVPSSHRRSSTWSPSLNPFASDDHSVESLYRRQSFTTPESQRTPRYLIPDEDSPRAIALYNFRAVEPGDLSFLKGEVITITQMSDKTEDWWTGKIGDRSGLFPANFVEVV